MSWFSSITSYFTDSSYDNSSNAPFSPSSPTSNDQDIIEFNKVIESSSKAEKEIADNSAKILIYEREGDCERRLADNALKVYEAIIAGDSAKVAQARSEYDSTLQKCQSPK